jgi:hypothetical protein
MAMALLPAAGGRHLSHTPGVHAWATDGNVMYVGMTSQLRQVVHGTRMDRAYTAVRPAVISPGLGHAAGTRL